MGAGGCDGLGGMQMGSKGGGEKRWAGGRLVVL